MTKYKTSLDLYVAIDSLVYEVSNGLLDQLPSHMIYYHRNMPQRRQLANFIATMIDLEKVEDREEK